MLVFFCFQGPIQSQFRVNAVPYTTFQGAIDAVPASGVQTIIEVTADYIETASNTIINNKKILLKSDGGIYTIKLGTALSSTMLTINAGAELELQNITVDGGAIWSDESLTVHADTIRMNSGIVGVIPLIVNKGVFTLGNAATIQNHQNITPYSRTGLIDNTGIIYLNDGSLIKGISYTPNDNDTGAGVIYSTGASAHIYMNGNATIAGCMSHFDGNDAGVIFSQWGALVTMNDSAKIYGCYTLNSGAITQREGVFTMNNNASIFNCYSSGVLAYTRGSIVMNDSTSIHDNETYNNGGGVYLSSNSAQVDYGSILRMNGFSRIYNNKSKGRAGGVYAANSWVYMNDSARIENNEAEKEGGGIYIGRSSSGTIRPALYFSSESISNNRSKTYGGGVYITSYSSLFVQGGKIRANEAGAAGGGIYATGLLDSVLISGGVIQENQALTGGGIGIANQANLIMKGGVVSKNNASVRGGGLQIFTDTTNYPMATILETAVINDNTAPKGSAVSMSADKLGGPASVFNLHGSALVKGEIFLEKDTLNGPDPKRNKYVTLITAPTKQYTLSTDFVNDSQNGRIVVVPGSTTVDGTNYSITDATPYISSFSHPIKKIVEGLPSSFTDKKLILGCYDSTKVEISLSPADSALVAASQQIQTNLPDTLMAMLNCRWTATNATLSDSASVQPTVTWSAAGTQTLTLTLTDTTSVISYGIGDKFDNCPLFLTKEVVVRNQNVNPSNPSIYLKVTLNDFSFKCYTTDPTAGIYYVKEGECFSFRFLYEECCDVPYDFRPVVIAGKDTLSADNEGNYTVCDIHKPLEIRIITNEAPVLPVGNETMEDTEHLWAYGRQLYVQTQTAGTITIYTLAGQILKNQKVEAGQTSISLSQGAYFVKDTKGKFRKIIIK